MKIRILELGSNSFQLHGFELSRLGAIKHLWGIKRPVRLVEGLSADGTLDRRFVSVGMDAVAELLARSRDDNPLVCFATSAVREASNRDVLLAPLARRFGLAPRVLSGAEEAKLAYAGALATLDGPVRRLCVVDIGGGSTEIAVGDHLGVGFTHSARVGTLLGPRAPEAFRTLLCPVLDRVRLYAPERLVFASGTARTLKALLMAQGLIAAGTLIPTTVVERLLPNLSLLSVEDVAGVAVDKEQRSSLVTGAELLLGVARALDVRTFDVSDGGLREGAALREWHRRRLRPGGSGATISDRSSPLLYAAAAGGWLPMSAST